MVNFPHQTVIPWLINSQVTSKQSFLHYFDVKTESLKIGMQKGRAVFKCGHLTRYHSRFGLQIKGTLNWNTNKVKHIQANFQEEPVLQYLFNMDSTLIS